ncbi:arylamine N-acetyltransferase [Ignatzschineria rhizosphaerae]|uniref:Arylamine N-acetyltransferase n=1 Tax=Ignatzschineria rhizosphaerae TaxID=2923279 RepID=A0ABY3X907_9GAMM|nr:arylamine N-acetyltransferase [Ignatzschineria rhizosphaerae]UNM97201.1 arylamine N-acetyltransferase [Ignatzschineria rhizosphaerae]
MAQLTHQDIQLYQQKLGITDFGPPTLKLLTLIQQKHIEAFPFQSISTLSEELISLKLQDMMQKVVMENRGGYCYELNMLLLHLLQYLGFEAEIISGRIVHQNDILALTQRTHVLLKVTIDEQLYICDVGYGGLVPPIPLLIKTHKIQPTNLGAYQIIYHPKEKIYTLNCQVADKWQILYSFELTPQPFVDLIVGNWFISTYPQSPFKQRLMVAKTEAGMIRHSLLNNRYSCHELGQPSTHITFNSSAEILAFIKDQFQLEILHESKSKASISALLDRLSQDQ